MSAEPADISVSADLAVVDRLADSEHVGAAERADGLGLAVDVDRQRGDGGDRRRIARRDEDHVERVVAVVVDHGDLVIFGQRVQDILVRGRVIVIVLGRVCQAEAAAGTDLLKLGRVGLGIGLVFLSGGSTGGSDIAAKLLRRRFRSASLGKVLLAIDLFIIFLTGVVFRDISRTLYSALPLAVSSVVMDQLLYGLDHSTVALIISEQYQAVSAQIAVRLDRGATVLEGSGSYTGSPRPVLMSAVRQKELPELKSIVREIDPDAFITIVDSSEIVGKGFRGTN